VTKELELAAVGSLSGVARPGRKARPAHTWTHCLDCGAELQGPYCHQCGQSADDHHRSILHLAWEAVEGLTHLDGRLARTLPPLLFRPGRLARDQIEGRRTRHVPPFRLFLITLVGFLLAFELGNHGRPEAPRPVAAQHVKLVVHGTAFDVEGKSAKEIAETRKGLEMIGSNPFGRWVIEHVTRVRANKQLFRAQADQWAHRLAILLLPMFATLLCALYFYKRQFFAYDHLLVAMQFLSFIFLVWGLAWLLPGPLRRLGFLAAAIWTPVNLFMILRGGYGSSALGAGLKTAVLTVSTVVLFAMLVVAVMLVAMGQV
jgi:hypothetical protein